MSLTAELEQKMQEIIDRQEPPGDQELDHIQADALLVAAARACGFGTLCDLYERVEKWYA